MRAATERSSSGVIDTFMVLRVGIDSAPSRINKDLCQLLTQVRFPGFGRKYVDSRNPFLHSERERPTVVHRPQQVPRWEVRGARADIHRRTAGAFSWDWTFALVGSFDPAVRSRYFRTRLRCHLRTRVPRSGGPESPPTGMLHNSMGRRCSTGTICAFSYSLRGTETSLPPRKSLVSPSPPSADLWNRWNRAWAPSSSTEHLTATSPPKRESVDTRPNYGLDGLQACR